MTVEDPRRRDGGLPRGGFGVPQTFAELNIAERTVEQKNGTTIIHHTPESMIQALQSEKNIHHNRVFAHRRTQGAVIRRHVSFSTRSEVHILDMAYDRRGTDGEYVQQMREDITEAVGSRLPSTEMTKGEMAVTEAGDVMRLYPALKRDELNAQVETWLHDFQSVADHFRGQELPHEAGFYRQMEEDKTRIIYHLQPQSPDEADENIPPSQNWVTSIPHGLPNGYLAESWKNVFPGREVPQEILELTDIAKPLAILEEAKSHGI